MVRHVEHVSPCLAHVAPIGPHWPPLDPIAPPSAQIGTWHPLAPIGTIGTHWHRRYTMLNRMFVVVPQLECCCRAQNAMSDDDSEFLAEHWTEEHQTTMPR